MNDIWTGANHAHNSQWAEFLEELVAEGKLLQASFSGPRDKSQETSRKLTVRPIKLKDGLYYQFERQANNKAYHDNVPAALLKERLEAAMAQYRQALFKTPEADVQALANKKGELSLLHDGRAVPQRTGPRHQPDPQGRFLRRPGGVRRRIGEGARRGGARLPGRPARPDGQRTREQP